MRLASLDHCNGLKLTSNMAVGAGVTAQENTIYCDPKAQACVSAAQTLGNLGNLPCVQMYDTGICTTMYTHDGCALQSCGTQGANTTCDVAATAIREVIAGCTNNGVTGGLFCGPPGVEWAVLSPVEAFDGGIS